MTNRSLSGCFRGRDRGWHGYRRGVRSKRPPRGPESPFAAERRASLDATADGIRAAGGEVSTVVADVTVEEDVVRLMASAIVVRERIGREWWPTQAVVADLPPTTSRMSNEFVRVLNLNVVSTLLCIKHAVPQPRTVGRRFVCRDVIDRGPCHAPVLRGLPGRQGRD